MFGLISVIKMIKPANIIFGWRCLPEWNELAEKKTYIFKSIDIGVDRLLSGPLTSGPSS